jgi:hypothetical protein
MNIFQGPQPLLYHTREKPETFLEELLHSHVLCVKRSNERIMETLCLSEHMFAVQMCDWF